MANEKTPMEERDYGVEQHADAETTKVVNLAEAQASQFTKDWFNTDDDVSAVFVSDYQPPYTWEALTEAAQNNVMSNEESIRTAFENMSDNGRRKVGETIDVMAILASAEVTEFERLVTDLETARTAYLAPPKPEPKPDDDDDTDDDDETSETGEAETSETETAKPEKRTRTDFYASETCRDMVDTIVNRYVRVQERFKVEPLVKKVRSLAGINTATWFAHVQAAERDMLQDNTAVEAAEREASFYNEAGAFLPLVMAKDLIENRPAITLPTDGEVRLYDNGVYVTDYTQAVERYVIDIIGDAYQPAWGEKTRKVVTSLTTLAMPPKGKQPCQQDYRINLQNGILDVRTLELSPHTPDEHWIHQLPVQYNPDATCPNFDAWLREVQENRLQDIELIHEIIGVSMLQQVLTPKIYFFLGETHTGKSTLLNVIKTILGEQQISDVAFHELGGLDDRFASAKLVGSLANLDYDVTFKRIEDVGRIKKIATGELISVQNKGQNRFSLKPYSTLIGATNEPIKSADWTSGWYSRLVVLNFKLQHQGEKLKVDIEDTFTTPDELSGILNHALDGIKRLIATGQHTASESVAENQKKFASADNHVLRWFEESYCKVDGQNVSAESVETAFDEWCDNERIKKPTKTTLRTTLQSKGIHYRRLGSRDERTFVYENFGEKDMPEQRNAEDEVSF